MKKAWFILYRWYSAMEENGINSTLSSNPDLSTLLKNGTSRHDDRPFVVWISSLIVVTAILIIIFNTLVVFTFSRLYHHMDNKTVFYVFIAISDFFAGVYLLTSDRYGMSRHQCIFPLGCVCFYTLLESFYSMCQHTTSWRWQFSNILKSNFHSERNGCVPNHST